MPLISVGKQKELVMLLFFWEEEIVRWNLLSVEEMELRERFEAGEGDVREELEALGARMRLRPSLRDQSGRESGRVSIDAREELPSYEQASRERQGR